MITAFASMGRILNLSHRCCRRYFPGDGRKQRELADLTVATSVATWRTRRLGCRTA